MRCLVRHSSGTLAYRDQAFEMNNVWNSVDAAIRVEWIGSFDSPCTEDAARDSFYTRIKCFKRDESSSNATHHRMRLPTIRIKPFTVFSCAACFLELFCLNEHEVKWIMHADVLSVFCNVLLANVLNLWPSQLIKSFKFRFDNYKFRGTWSFAKAHHRIGSQLAGKTPTRLHWRHSNPSCGSHVPYGRSRKNEIYMSRL